MQFRAAERVRRREAARYAEGWIECQTAPSIDEGEAGAIVAGSAFFVGAFRDQPMGVRGVWAVVAVLGTALAGPAVAACKVGRLAELPVTMLGLEPTVPARINGREVRFLADSGPSTA